MRWEYYFKGFSEELCAQFHSWPGGAVTIQKRLWLNPHEEEQRKRKQKSPWVYFTHGPVMPPKKRQNDSETGKKNKKEKRGELAAINSDMRDHAVQKGMTDAWQRKESYSNGMYAHPRDTLSLHYFSSHLNSYCEQNLFAFQKWRKIVCPFVMSVNPSFLWSLSR